MHTALLGQPDDFVSHIAEPRWSYGLEAVTFEMSCVQRAAGCATIEKEFGPKCNWHLTYLSYSGGILGRGHLRLVRLERLTVAYLRQESDKILSLF